LLFKDKFTKQLYNFDLESGKIVDEIGYKDNLVQVCNDSKNSQVDASAIFQAIS